MSYEGLRGDGLTSLGGIKSPGSPRGERGGEHGLRGEPGPYCARTELELVAHLIQEFERASSTTAHQFNMGDGHNHRTSVDGYAVLQAVGALRNYQVLLSHPLNELIAPYVFHARNIR